MPCRLPPRALPRQQAALHRSGGRAEAQGRARADAIPLEFFKAHPCTDCGETDPVVLEFDHLRDKSFNISSNFRERAWQSILDEMEKCEVVCANCHRRRTAKRRGALRFLLTEE